MRARVVRAYTDRIDRTVHQAGSEVELTEARAAELARKGVVEPVPDGSGAAGDEPGGELGEMTVAQLRELIAGRGGTAPKRATKAQLLEIAGSL